jgi:branched-chain amino acid transport system substrate-binding protein
MKQLGIDAKFMGGDGLCTNDLPTLAAGAMANGQVVCGSPGGIDWAAAEMTRFAANYKAKFGISAQYYAPYAYDAVMIMADAMVRAGSSDPAKYLPALAATSGYHGLSGTISFDAKGDIRNGAVTLFTYNGGKKGPIGEVQ